MCQSYETRREGLRDAPLLGMMEGLEWERGLVVGSPVLVCWGYGGAFRAWGPGVVERVYPKSFRVRLLESVPGAAGGDGWSCGYVLKGITRRAVWGRWHPHLAVHPLPAEASEEVQP